MSGPVVVAEECRLCRGWGFVLGTDTPDKWGKICDCGCDIHAPANESERAILQAAHDKVRSAGRRTLRIPS
jgi:hypothetical protein